MPNRFTRVPEGTPPALPALARLLIPPADLFMLLMLSRPNSGSLRTTWVTPGTLALCALMVVVGVPLGAVALTSGHGLRVVAGLVIIILAAGSAAVLAVGLLQRR